MAAETPVLRDLVLEHLPKWISSCETFISSKSKSRPTSIISAGETTETENELVGPIPVKPEYETSLNSADEQAIIGGKGHGSSKLAQKPDASRQRFSTLTSPVIWYDGDGQKYLFEMWENINRGRGDLRKEIMLIRRKFQKDKYRPLQSILETTDKHLETATRLTENAAFKMLKGEEYLNHLRCIVRRFNNAGTDIEKSGLMEPAPPEEPEPQVFPFAAEDNGDGILEADDGDSSEEDELPAFTLPVRRGPMGAGGAGNMGAYRNARMQPTPVRKPEPLEPEPDALLAVDDDTSSDDDADGDTKMEDLKLSYRRAGVGTSRIGARLPPIGRPNVRTRAAANKPSTPSTDPDPTTTTPLLS